MENNSICFKCKNFITRISHDQTIIMFFYFLKSANELVLSDQFHAG